MTGGVGLPQIDSAKASGRKEYTRSYRRQTVDEQDFHRLATVATGKRSTAARLKGLQCRDLWQDPLPLTPFLMLTEHWKLLRNNFRGTDLSFAGVSN